MVKEFRYSFDELEIVNSEIELLMGFEDGILPEPFPELIEFALKTAPSICNIRGGYKIFNPNDCSIEKQTFKICGYIFNPSKVVITHLKMPVLLDCLFVLPDRKSLNIQKNYRLKEILF